MIKMIILSDWTFVKFYFSLHKLSLKDIFIYFGETMYRGCNKTALSSQRQIAEAFVNLLKHNSYSSISISSICKAAGVSRQTFYSLFASKENIILYELGKKHHFTPGEGCGKKTMDLKDLCQEYSSYIIEKRDFLSLLVRNDIIYLMHECLYDSFLSSSCFEPECPEDYRSFIAEFFAGGLSGIARTYVLRGMDMPESRLESLVYDLFSGSLVK